MRPRVDSTGFVVVGFEKKFMTWIHISVPPRRPLALNCSCCCCCYEFMIGLRTTPAFWDWHCHNEAHFISRVQSAVVRPDGCISSARGGGMAKLVQKVIIHIMSCGWGYDFTAKKCREFTHGREWWRQRVKTLPPRVAVQMLWPMIDILWPLGKVIFDIFLLWFGLDGERHLK